MGCRLAWCGVPSRAIPGDTNEPRVNARSIARDASARLKMVRTRVASVASVVGDGGGVIGAPREEEVERRVEDRPSPGRDVAVGTAPLGAPDGRRFGVRYLSRDGTTRRAGAAGNARVRGAGCRGCRHSCAATGSTLATADIAAARYPSRVARENGYGGKEERWRDLPSEPPSGD